ncbi:sensor histidine kinase [Terribacillus saccharophilus]|uniref:LytS/YhcK type 5TM receptor domain-containing protein n=1 Tax=Terribacillus saccharophilus TaxID=361277 RepID=UPI00398286BA
MLSLVPLMIERVGIILITVFLFSQLKAFRRLILHNQSIKERLLLLLIFGFFGVLSNYTGVEIHGDSRMANTWLLDIEQDSAIANTRILGVTIGGLLGGPFVGLGVGFLAGIHRLFLGGFTAEACAISTVLAGLAAGLIGKRRKQRKQLTAGYAILIGVAMEIIQMMLILLLSSEMEPAWQLVQIIGLPMIVINGIGMLLFMLIIQIILREQERTRALQTNAAFAIADRTLPYFRKGLNTDSCNRVAEIMLEWTEADAIAITDKHSVLTHVGAGSDHHLPTTGFATELTKRSLREGRVLTAKSQEEIVCSYPDCSLQAAVVLPLRVGEETAGTLKLYFTNPNDLTRVERELAEGLANLFSTQLELAEAEQQSKLLKDAEIKALQAQVHPHFLFNSINTISILCRTDPNKARSLLQELSRFFRSNLQGARHMLIPIEKEIEHIRAYISLEQARFPEKFTLQMEIEPGLEQTLVPPFLLQPLVENSVKHGFRDTEADGKIAVSIKRKDTSISISVLDNGHGMEPHKLNQAGQQTVESLTGTGTALMNIRERLEGIYNHEATLLISSKKDEGTTIHIQLPNNQKGEIPYDDSLYRGG